MNDQKPAQHTAHLQFQRIWVVVLVALLLSACHLLTSSSTSPQNEQPTGEQLSPTSVGAASEPTPRQPANRPLDVEQATLMFPQLSLETNESVLAWVGFSETTAPSQIAVPHPDREFIAYDLSSDGFSYVSLGSGILYIEPAMIAGFPETHSTYEACDYPNYDVQWSPNGSEIAFTCLDGNNFNVFIYNFESDDFYKVINDTGIDRRNPAWDPRGYGLAYLEDDPTTGEFVLYWRYLSDRQRPVRLSPESVHIEMWTNPQFSPDGSEVYYVAYDGAKYHIIAASTNGSSSREVAIGRDFAFSSDGQQMIYSDSGTIHIVNIDGTDDRILPEDGLCPAFSPLGRLISFVRGGEGLNVAGLYVMNADGSGITRIATVWDQRCAAYQWQNLSPVEIEMPAAENVQVLAKAQISALSSLYLYFDPTIWDTEPVEGYTDDQGEPTMSLLHQSIPECKIHNPLGTGLPLGIVAQDIHRSAGEINFIETTFTDSVTGDTFSTQYSWDNFRVFFILEPGQDETACKTAAEDVLVATVKQVLTDNK